MNAVTQIVGVPHVDSSRGACRALSHFLRVWIAELSCCEQRFSLARPPLPQLLDLCSTPEVEQQRGWLAFDWLVRVRTPAWLQLACAPPEHAQTLCKLQHALQNLTPIKDLASAVAAGTALRSLEADAMSIWSAARAGVACEVRGPAIDAVRATAWSAAWAAWTAVTERSPCDAAWAAASSVAWAAAWDTLWATRAAAWGAHDAAPGKAADAARQYLAPTVEMLQASALDLIERMLAVTAASIIADGGQPPLTRSAFTAASARVAYAAAAGSSPQQLGAVSG